MLYKVKISLLLVLSLLSFVHVSISSRSGHSHSKSVKILLNSKWQQTPIYLEVAEFLSEENQDFFWHYLEDLQTELDNDGYLDAANLTQYQQYTYGIRLASKLLRSESKLSILKFSLALRSYSPKVIVFKNIVDDIVNSNELENCADAFIEFSLPNVTLSPSLQPYICDIDKIKTTIDFLLDYMRNNPDNVLNHPEVYSVDHVYPGRYSSMEPAPKSLTLVLYSNVGSKKFFRFHKLIKQQIASGKPIRYLIRHFSSSKNDSPRVTLSGYGVELAIKSTEYKAQDDTRVRGEVVDSNLFDESEQSKPDEVGGFVFSQLKSNNAELSEKLNEFRNYLMDQEKEIATLKVWELQEISLQAVTKILSVQKEKALSIMKDIAQNFPSVARSLVQIHVEPDLKREIIKNQHVFFQNLNLATSDTALFINGLYHDVDSVDVFTLFDTVKQEYYTTSKLHLLLNGDHKRIKKLDTSWDTQQNFDFQLDFRDAAVLYINDIENDLTYRNWPSSLQEMLRPTYPGMLRNIRRNMYHLVLVVDPSKKESFDMLRMAESFYIHKAPVRIGIVFDVISDSTKTGYQDAGIAVLEAYNYISMEKSAYEALSFITDVIAYATSQTNRNLEPDDIVYHFKSKIKPSTDLDDIFGPDSSYDIGRKLANDFLERTGLENGPKALLNGVLLKESHLNADYFEDAVLSEIMRQSSQLQKAIYKNELTDQDDILEWLMSKKTVMTRLNRIIFGMDQSNQKKVDSSKYLDISTGHVLKSATTNIDSYFSVNINDLQATLVSSLKYINSKKDCNPVTLWFVSDFLLPESRQILLASLNHLKESSRAMRLAFIYVEQNSFTRLLESAMSSFTSSLQLLNFLSKVSVLDNFDIEQIKELVPDDFRKAFLERYEALNDSKSAPFPLHQAVASRQFGLSSASSDQLVLVLNNKIFKVFVRNPNTGKAIFNKDDFSLMERYVQNFWSEKIMSILSETEKSAGNRKCSDLVLKICSVLLAKVTTSKQRYDISNVNDDHSVLTLEPRLQNEPFIDLTVILDPLTRLAFI